MFVCVSVFAVEATGKPLSAGTGGGRGDSGVEGQQRACVEAPINDTAQNGRSVSGLCFREQQSEAY